jgi:O-antigen biosynthesis protein
MPRFRRKRYHLSRVDVADRARDAGKWELAARLYREALDHDPDNPSIWVQYGHSLKESGKLQDSGKLARAEFAYRQALSLDSAAADPYLQLGHVLKLQGKTEEAEAAYLRAFALDPSVSYPIDELRSLGWSEVHIAELRGLAAAEAVFSMAQSSEVGLGDGVTNGAAALLRAEYAAANGAERDARLISESGLFDPAWYVAQNPNVAAAGMDPLTHYLAVGSAEGRRPNSLFDPVWYRTQNPDVAASGMEPLAHYVEHGCAEGRRPREFPPPPARHVDLSYLRWVAEYNTLDDEDREAIFKHITFLFRRPLFSVVMPVYNTKEKYLRETIESVIQQLYPNWELCIADDASTESHVQRVLEEFAARDHRIKFIRREINGHISAATNTALDLAVGEFVALLDHDDVLAETALYEVAVEVDSHPDADIIYSDSDHIDVSGRRWAPYFKTDWNPDLMLGHNMVNHLAVYRRSLVETIGRLHVGLEGSQDYDLILRAADASAPSRIRHIPAVLYHWRRNGPSPSFSESSLDRCVVAAGRAIREHLARTGIMARVDVHPREASWTRIVYLLPPERPLVSIIVPTRDKADLLARCADGVLTRTDYAPLELVIVDNDSEEPETHRAFARLTQDPRVRILRHPGTFNYSAINNHAVQEARGSIVVLMNNDIDVISPEWLEEMVSHAIRPEIGAVGAKLLYPDGRVQHAGVFLGVGGLAGHLHQRIDRADFGSFGRAILTGTVSAVTAACLVIRKSVFEEVGGLDAVNLAVAYSDVDLCLKIREHGYRNVWTPFAELYHLESASRGSDESPRNIERFRKEADHLRRTWGNKLDTDPYYNLNCSPDAGNFEPAFPPRRRPPWLGLKTGKPSR